MVEIRDIELTQVSVLGSMLIDERVIGGVLAEVRDEDFITPKYRMVFQAIRKLFTAGEPVDPVTVMGKLGGAQGDGWSTCMLEMMEVTPTAANVLAYTVLLREQVRLKKLNELGMLLGVAQNLDSALDYMAKANGLLVDRPSLKYVTMEQAMLDFFERHREKKEYLTWGLDKLNDRLYVEGGDLVVLGGYASAGKTALALMFAWHWASRGMRVGFYSLETGEKKLQDRLVAYSMKMNFSKIKRSELDDSDYEALAIATPRLIKPQLEWVGASGMTVEEIQASALSRGYDAVFIDYLQLINCKGSTRTDEVSKISIGLHQMSQSTGIAVVALSQLSRPEKDKGNRVAPSMSSLRESGQIEQDADVVMLLYNEEDTPSSRRILHIAKNKEGEQGKMYLNFDGAIQTFKESAVDAPAPKRREEPQLKQVQFYDLDDNPFARGGGDTVCG